MAKGIGKILALTIALACTCVLGQEVTKEETKILREARNLRAKDPAAAKTILEKRLKEKPSDVLLFELGLWQVADGEDEKAIAVYKKLVDKNPAYPGALRNLGIIQLRTKRYGDATKTLATLSRREDLGAELQRSLGYAFTHLGNHTAALAAYRRAVIGFPNDHPLQERIAQTLYQLKSIWKPVS